MNEREAAAAAVFGPGYRDSDFAGWDLHTHTWYSDGVLSPAQLVEMAKEKGLKTLAVTDHDGIFGLSEAATTARRLGLCFITGAELSVELPLTETETAYMHVLGYGFDPQNRELNVKLEAIREQRRARNEKMLRALEELGYPLSAEDIEVYPGQDYIGKPNFARALVVRGYAADVAEAFSSPRMMAAPSVKALHREKIGAAEGISLIKKAGGMAALAHPYKTTWPGRRQEKEDYFLPKLEKILQTLIGEGLAGMECYYSSHSQKQEGQLLSLAARYGLAVTAGSDYHGPGIKKDVELGGIHGY